MIKRSARILRQGRGYLVGLAWLLRQSITRQPAYWRRIVIATGFNIGGNAAVIAIAYAYVRVLETNQSLHGLGIVIEPRDSLGLLLLVVLAIVLALLTFSVSEYVGRATALRLARVFQEDLFRRIMHGVHRLPHPHGRHAQDILRRYNEKQLALQYAHSTAWALRFIANAVPGVIQFGMALVALIVLDPMTTLAVGGLGIAIVAAQYPANLFAAKSSRTADQIQRPMIHSFNDLAAAINRALPPPAADDVGSRIDGFYDVPKTRRYMDADEDRYRAQEVSALTMQVGGAFLLAAVLITIGASLLRDGGDWAMLIAYLTVLRLLVTALTRVFRAITVFSRFYPYLRIIRDFLVSAENVGRADGEADKGADGVRAITLSARHLDEGPGVLELRPGTLVAIWTRSGYGRDLIMDLDDAQRQADGRHGIIRLALSPPSRDEIRAWGADPDAEGCREWMTARRADNSIEEALSRVADDHAHMVLLDHVALNAIGDARWRHWRGLLADRVLGVVYADPMIPAAGNGESIVIVRRADGSMVWTEIPAEGMSDVLWRRLHALLPGGAAPAEKAIDDDDDAMLE